MKKSDLQNQPQKQETKRQPAQESNPLKKEIPVQQLKTPQTPGQNPATKPTGNQSGTPKTPGQPPGGHNGLHGLFVDQLKDIYWAEKALNEKLPEMISKASSKELTEALNQHLFITEKQISRCEDVFGRLNVKVTPQTSNAMSGLLRDAKRVIDSTTPGSVRDAGIISATQKVDHFKIAAYGTLTAFANQLGEKDSARLLKETLQEEKDADQRLTQVAQYTINEAAAHA
jgi:ferritin-like metal-binding protein YciE